MTVPERSAAEPSSLCGPSDGDHLALCHKVPRPPSLSISSIPPSVVARDAREASRPSRALVRLRPTRAKRRDRPPSARVTVPERSLAGARGAQQGPAVRVDRRAATTWLCCEAHQVARPPSLSISSIPPSVVARDAREASRPISSARAVAPDARKASSPTPDRSHDRLSACWRPGAQQSPVVCVDRQTAFTWLCCEAPKVPRPPSVSISSIPVWLRATTPAKRRDHLERSHDRPRALACLRPGAQQSLVVCVDRRTATTGLCCISQHLEHPRVVARDTREASSPT